MREPTYLPRSWWADPDWARGGAQLVDDDLHRLGNVCHYPGRASAFGVMSLANLRSNLRGWWSYHVNGRGWADIGYQACVSMTVEGPVVVDLRGIGRVPAAHASASNPRANWHGGATLWTIGNTETPHPEMIEAYRHFRTRVWLKRWPTATGVTHHRRVPGAQTSCAGDKMDLLVRAGALTQHWTQGDDDVTPQELLDTEIPLTGSMQAWFGTGVTKMSVAGLLGYAGAGAWASTRMLIAAQPLLAAAAAGRALSVAEVAQLAEAITAAIPGELADDVVDEIRERLET